MSKSWLIDRFFLSKTGLLCRVLCVKLTIVRVFWFVCIIFMNMHKLVNMYVYIVTVHTFCAHIPVPSVPTHTLVIARVYQQHMQHRSVNICTDYFFVCQPLGSMLFREGVASSKYWRFTQWSINTWPTCFHMAVLLFLWVLWKKNHVRCVIK